MYEEHESRAPIWGLYILPRCFLSARYVFSLPENRVAGIYNLGICLCLRGVVCLLSGREFYSGLVSSNGCNDSPVDSELLVWQAAPY